MLHLTYAEIADHKARNLNQLTHTAVNTAANAGGRAAAVEAGSANDGAEGVNEVTTVLQSQYRSAQSGKLEQVVTYKAGRRSLWKLPCSAASVGNASYPNLQEL